MKSRNSQRSLLLIGFAVPCAVLGIVFLTDTSTQVIGGFLVVSASILLSAVEITRVLLVRKFDEEKSN